MKNLLKRLGMAPKRSVRVSRNIRTAMAVRQVTSTQIARMGQFGQQLVVMSK